MRFSTVSTALFEGCGRNKNMNIECQLFRFKITIPQPASTELQNSPQHLFAIFIRISFSFCAFSFSFWGVLFSPHFTAFAL